MSISARRWAGAADVRTLHVQHGHGKAYAFFSASDGSYCFGPIDCAAAIHKGLKQKTTSHDPIPIPSGAESKCFEKMIMQAEKPPSDPNSINTG